MPDPVVIPVVACVCPAEAVSDPVVIPVVACVVCGSELCAVLGPVKYLLRLLLTVV